jgi:hypothetical protein
MARRDSGNYARKHSPDRKADPAVAKAVNQRAKGGEIACATAFDIVNELGVTPDEVGLAVDLAEIRIVKCQLGLYGYQSGKSSLAPADSISPDLEEAIRSALNEGRLACKASWEIAERFGIAKMGVSSACEALKIKISSCQLGAF